MTKLTLSNIEIVEQMGEGASQRLEAQLDAGLFIRLDSAGYPPADFPLNRGDWFEVRDLLQSLDGSLYLREQSLYTGTCHSSKDAVYSEVRLARAPRADI